MKDDLNKIEEEEEYPKFSDVYEEIIEYFKSLNEPLLTKDLSHLFIQILNILLIQPNEILDKQINTSRKEPQRNKKHIKKQCSTQRLLSLIVENVSNNTSKTPPPTGNNDIESKLLESAKLPSIIPLEADDEDLELQEQGELEEKEQAFYQLLNSLAELEHCCDECLTSYNEINAYLQSTKSMVEFDEFLMYLNSDDMQPPHLSNQSNEMSGHQTMMMPTSRSSLFLQSQIAQLSAEIVNEYENDDLIDIDDDEYVNANVDEEDFAYSTLKERNYLLDSDLVSFSSIMFPGMANNMNAKQNPIKHKSMTKSLSDKKMHRNNSFRAAIDGGCNDDDKQTADEQMSPKNKLKPVYAR